MSFGHRKQTFQAHNVQSGFFDYVLFCVQFKGNTYLKIWTDYGLRRLLKFSIFKEDLIHGINGESVW